MAKEKDNKGLTVKKEENFSEWFTQIIEKAEIVDIRTGMKGFVAIRPWATQTIEKMYEFYENELHKNKHKPVMMPTLIPESNLKKESSHIKGFTPEVFWLKTKTDEGKLALRPTSETLFTPMFKLWARSHRDLPMKLYQRCQVFRLDTKATRPLIRGREFHWIEAHDAFATKEEAEKQVQEDIQMTEDIMHQKFCVPFLPMKRPEWDKFAGAEYTIGSDSLLPDGKLIQQPSTHLMGQKFSKAFDAKFKNEDGKEDYLWTTAYGPAMSRILVSVIALHGDDNGLVMPACLSPIQIVIVPIYKKENKSKILKYASDIQTKLKEFRTEIDNREVYSPGWKFNEWELKGVPFRIEIGEKEMKKKEVTLFHRDTKKKETLSLNKLTNIKKYSEDFDKRLKEKADKFFKSRITNCKTKNELKEAMNAGKIARVELCSTNPDGLKCAEIVEKEINADIRGTLANKRETPKGKCIICNKKANEIAYIGRSY